ncbi:WbqC family protein [Nonomuraea sp. NPDC050310]|uniref:WbqC family protein n=1 Tax=Nonomuraea sp. NPDC050310 TaxID=3154935 RepID=UPI0033EA6754
MPGTTAASLPLELLTAGGLVVAVHQPNLFPRLSTLAKLYAADRWVILDDVQFNGRDYQNRTRLATLDDAHRQTWLTLATHLPRGRSTLIRDATLAEPDRCRRRLTHMLPQHYKASPHWPYLRERLQPVLDRFDGVRSVSEVAVSSTLLLLGILGWPGRAVASSGLPSRHGRSTRLADLTAVSGGRIYLCGTGGMKYLDVAPFKECGIRVVPFAPGGVSGLWGQSRRVTALNAFMMLGPELLAAELRHQARSVVQA